MGFLEQCCESLNIGSLKPPVFYYNLYPSRKRYCIISHQKLIYNNSFSIYVHLLTFRSFTTSVEMLTYLSHPLKKLAICQSLKHFSHMLYLVFTIILMSQTIQVVAPQSLSDLCMMTRTGWNPILGLLILNC